jgi:hypothetical protein
VAVTPYNSHIATGVFVIWKRVPVPAGHVIQTTVKAVRR